MCSMATVRHTGRAALFALALLLCTAPFTHAAHAININTADAETLTQLVGIGTVIAQRIVDYRQQYGPFAAIEEIQNVSGIGAVIFSNIKDHITIEGGHSSGLPPGGEGEQEALAQRASGASTSAPITSLFVTAGGDRTIVAGAEVSLIARALDGERKPADERVHFFWNFGDGTTGTGRAVTHRWMHPGRYAVVVKASHYDTSATHRITVTADAPQFGLTLLADGGVLLENRTGREVDVSHWKVADRTQEFALPEGTMLLPDGALRLSPAVLRFAASSLVELRFPSGEVVTSAAEVEEAPAGASPAPSPAQSASERAAPRAPSPAARIRGATQAVQAPAPLPPAGASSTIEGEHALDSLDASGERGRYAAAAAAAAGGGSGGWWVSLLGVMLTGVAATLIVRRYNRKEWDIEEG